MGSGRSWADAVREFLFGLSGYEFAQEALELRRSMDSLFMVVVFGDLVGVPVLPSYYALRLVPFVVPSLEAWKRKVLRERDLGDEHALHLHGV